MAHQNKAARNSACLLAITQFKHKKWKKWGLGPLFFKISEGSLGPRAFLEPMPYQVHGGTGSGFRSWISHCGVEHLHFNNPWSSFFWTQQWIKCSEFGTPHSHWVNFFLLCFGYFHCQEFSACSLSLRPGDPFSGSSESETNSGERMEKSALVNA